ncbi:hypothetical protein FGO68_gene7803 [Halteria grandinella]|uniref:Uncharacterized protein n=1 Tax=Halteria grandinella TaxID=5974 RepID=A0A8J8P3E0_HALGN|nr:hypothetical protein FGO68_gene7803 [Halteria grandinella]
MQKYQNEGSLGKLVQAISIRNFLPLIGSLLARFNFGMIFIWGNISTYVVSFINWEEQSKDDRTSIDEALIGLPISLVFMTVGLQISSHSSFKSKQQLLYLIGYLAFILGNFIAFRNTLGDTLSSFSAFLIPSSIISPLGIGLAYNGAQAISIKHFPKQQSLVSTLHLLAFGLGTCFWSLYSTIIMVNPENVDPKATLQMHEGQQVHGLFSDYSEEQKIYSNVSHLFDGLIKFWTVSAAISMISIIIPAAKANTIINRGSPNLNTRLLTREHSCDKDNERMNQALFIQALSSSQSMTLVSISSLSLVFHYFQMNTFKIFGFMIGHSDHYLTWLGALGALLGTLLRVLQPSYLPLKNQSILTCLSFVLLAQFTLSLTLTSVAFSQILYLLWNLAGSLCYSALFVLVPLLVQRIFGAEIGNKLFGCLYFIFSIVSLLFAYLLDAWLERVGYDMVMSVASICSLIALVIVRHGGLREEPFQQMAIKRYLSGAEEDRQWGVLEETQSKASTSYSKVSTRIN